jgi:hypothetical protein
MGEVSPREFFVYDDHVQPRALRLLTKYTANMFPIVLFGERPG